MYTLLEIILDIDKNELQGSFCVFLLLFAKTLAVTKWK